MQFQGRHSWKEFVQDARARFPEPVLIPVGVQNAVRRSVLRKTGGFYVQILHVGKFRSGHFHEGAGVS
jgi:hypothetical protein